MNGYLLDVNALVALFWPAHESHGHVQRWFARNAKAGWATCPFTQAATVRILSNPAFSPDALTVEEATDMVSSSLEHPNHRFWPDSISFKQAVEPFRGHIIGHQQVTDAYLLGLAIQRGGKIATLDRGVSALLRSEDRERVPIVLI